MHSTSLLCVGNEELMMIILGIIQSTGISYYARHYDFLVLVRHVLCKPLLRVHRSSLIRILSWQINCRLFPLPLLTLSPNFGSGTELIVMYVRSEKNVCTGECGYDTRP